MPLPATALLPGPTLYPSASPTADEQSWRPTIEQVAALLHSRTNVMGAEIGTFNDQTRPTGAQVEQLISIAVGDLSSRVGATIHEPWLDEAQRVAALQAAALVEASFFPAQLDDDRSAYRQYTAMYLSAIDGLRRIIGPSSATGVVSVGVASAVTADLPAPIDPFLLL